MIKEFKKFIMRGNMIDLAVGMIIGAAFNAIVTSLVNDIFMPILAAIIGKPDFSDLFIIFGDYEGVRPVTIEAAQEAGLTTLNYGNFITAIINFLLMALVVFFIVKGFNKLAEGGKKLNKKEEKKAEPTTKTCPFCQSEISIKATRCPHCTSELKK
ncbi:MAG: large conductance mechanosensitive channel protein MscL [Lachnospiraceae bacterium]|nr:large conductance mechanosensitive channel protein MscL [Lachnospiraceae bacterium]